MARKLKIALACIAALLASRTAQIFAADGENLTYYVQLIRGTHDLKAPEPCAHPIGSKLAKNLRPVFKWENYWEISRQRIELPRGRKTMVLLTKDRDVEIDLTNSTNRTVIARESGKVICRSTRPIAEGMSIIGGDRSATSVWFIVVRRDVPES